MSRFHNHPDRVDPSISSTPAYEDPCPEEAQFDPGLRSLSTEELEDRLIYSFVFPPSTGRRQVEALRAAAETYAKERRRCQHRVSLLYSLSSGAAALSHPDAWGRERSSHEIRDLFLTSPLHRPFDAFARQDLLLQVEEHVIPSLASECDEDTEFWRRMYYSLLLRTFLTDDGLAALGAQRPVQGLTFSPR